MSRMRYISAHTERGVRFVGLSTAVANAQDLAEWLGIGSKVTLQLYYFLLFDANPSTLSRTHTESTRRHIRVGVGGWLQGLDWRFSE